MVDDILYLGYGCNRSPDMMKAIIGRKPNGFPARLKDYELCIQTWDEMPLDVRRILENSWDSRFRTYCIRPAHGSVVTGVAWYLTRFERENLVGEWEMHGLWYRPVKVQVIYYNGQVFDAETEIINDPNIKQVVDGENYPTFLNSKERMLEVATKVRGEVLKERSS